MAAATRSVLHVDMDAFYASIEQRDDPSLRGQPLVVGGDTRGVVAAASYEARQFGIRSAMPMTEARRRCPGLVRVPVRMAHYRSVSRQIFDVFREFTPTIEGLSLDEAFLDVTASRKLFGDATTIARRIKARILERTALTASVGVAGNKLVAKIASDLDKPDGLVVIGPDDVTARLDPLPVAVIPGVGRETLARLQRAGILTVGQLRTADEREIEPIFGRFTHKTRQRAAGIDDRPVQPSREEKSISAEETFDMDLHRRRDIRRALLRLTERSAARLRKAGLEAGTVQVKIREADFTTHTRQRVLKPPANSTDRVYAAAWELLDEWLGENPDARLRLLGVGGSSLVTAAQGDLFEQPGEPGNGPVDRSIDRAIDRTVDEVRDRFGAAALARARTLGRSGPRS